jgi:alpha-L-rhamnosidase
MQHALVLLLIAPTLFGAAAIRPQQLRSEYRANPQGIDVTDPRLSWVLMAADPKARGLRQSAYRVIVASSDRALAAGTGDLWDTGKVASDQSAQVVYRGKPLTSGAAAFWKVQVWDQAGQPSDWSAPARWSMGLLHPQDWQAKWIGRDEPDTTTAHRLAARLLRKEFQADKPVRRATVYYSGLGLSELYLNGAKVGDHVLSPGLTDYDKHVLYVTFDVTKQIAAGRNAIGLMLGNGRYRAPRVDTRRTRNFGDPKAILRLDVEYQDGSRSSVVSDETWKLSSAGPILANNEYDGEEYDARMEQTTSSRRPRACSRRRWPSRCASPKPYAPSASKCSSPAFMSSIWARTWWAGAVCGSLAPRAPQSRCGTPKRSTPMARSTPPTCAPRASPIFTPSRAKARKSGSRASPTTASASSR